MQEAYKIGNAQSIGSYQVQSNYFASCCSSGCLVALADGSADHINGRRGAVLAVEACMHEFRCMPTDMEFSVFSKSVVSKVIRDMREIVYLGKTPYLSFSFGIIRDGRLHYYSVGSNQFFLYDGRGFHILKERCASVGFGKDMTAGIISRGVREALNEKEMMAYLAGKGHPYEKAQQMLAGVMEKNRKMAGNATILLVEGCI